MRILSPVEEEIRRTVETPGAKDPPIGVAGPEAVLQKHVERGFLSIRVEDGRKGSYGVNAVGRRLSWHPEREKSAMGKSERLKVSTAL